MHTITPGGRKMMLCLELLATKEQPRTRRELRTPPWPRCGAGLAPSTATMWCLFSRGARGRGGQQKSADITERSTTSSTTEATMVLPEDNLGEGFTRSITCRNQCKRPCRWLHATTMRGYVCPCLAISSPSACADLADVVAKIAKATWISTGKNYLIIIRRLCSCAV
jgi:hypothetical protein